jgi:putative hemolysin
MLHSQRFKISSKPDFFLQREGVPTHIAAIPQAEYQEGRYLLRYVRSRQELEAALKLRFQVFNLEMGEGLESSFAVEQDEDEYDASCHHLVVFDRKQEQVVGTYRLQTWEVATGTRGFYSATEFDLSLLSSGVLKSSVELGRACIAKEHRNTQVLFLLWKGIAGYVAYNQKRYLFGCCSLTSQDETEGYQVFEFLRQNGHMHESFQVTSKSGFECSPSVGTSRRISDVKLPKLFKIYLRFGAKVCSSPAIDRQFKTIDFLVIFDVDSMGSKAHRMLFGS